MLGQQDLVPRMECCAARWVLCWCSLQWGSACLKLLLQGMFLCQNPPMWLCWQRSSVSKKPELHIQSCHILHTSQNRILGRGNWFKALGHFFQNKFTEVSASNTQCVCRKTEREKAINQTKQSVYLSQLPLCSSDQILICSQVNKGQSLLDTSESTTTIVL